MKRQAESDKQKATSRKRQAEIEYYIKITINKTTGIVKQHTRRTANKTSYRIDI